MSASAAAATPIAVKRNRPLDELPEAIERLIETVKDETGPNDDEAERVDGSLARHVGTRGVEVGLCDGRERFAG